MRYAAQGKNGSVPAFKVRGASFADRTGRSQEKESSGVGPVARIFLSEHPAQIHTTFAFLLPYCSSLLMDPCGLRSRYSTAAGRGQTG
jgi:hypothetical protein